MNSHRESLLSIEEVGVIRNNRNRGQTTIYDVEIEQKSD